MALLEASCHSYLLQTAARSSEVEVGPVKSRGAELVAAGPWRSSQPKSRGYPGAHVSPKVLTFAGLN